MKHSREGRRKLWGLVEQAIALKSDSEVLGIALEAIASLSPQAIATRVETI
jgi:hypothetical protein